MLDGLHVTVDGRVLKIEFERPSQDIADLLSKGRGPFVFHD
jgi:hypothetical protein